MGYTVKIETLTPIWTGDENRKCTTLRETGILGSLRWWYEALIRGLGGTACDPTNTKCKGKDHCDACELFGCTGWARKFKLEIDGGNKSKEIQLKFIELGKVKNIEWALINQTLKIIENYGSIGGKIAESRYGLIKIKLNDLGKFSLDKTGLGNYLKNHGDHIENPNINKYIFVDAVEKHITIKEIKDNLSFLKGKSDKAKRYFYKTNNPSRFFTYAENNDEYTKIIEFFKEEKKTKHLEDEMFVEGKEILEGLK